MKISLLVGLFFIEVFAHTSQTDMALLGEDFNQNQVRDDVEDVIDELFSDTNIRIILKNGARIYQQAMLASQTPSNDDDEEVSLAFGHFAVCLYEFSDSSTARQRLAILRSLVLDTEERWMAYQKYNSGRHGTIMDGSNINLSECITTWDVLPKN